MGEVAKREETGVAAGMVSVADIVELAKKYPRDIKAFRQKILQTIEDPDVALACWYSLPKGGGVIEGPGIRAAEIIYSNYGNIIIKEAPFSVDGKRVIASCQAIDVETMAAIEKTTSRSIAYKNGNLYPDHLIETTGKAAQAVARRDAIYAIVPAAFVNGLVASAKERVDRAIAENPGAIKAYIAKALKEHNVDPKKLTEIYSTDGKPLEEMNSSQLKDMLGLVNALRAGYSVDKYLGTDKDGSGRKSLQGSGNKFSLKDLGLGGDNK